jgi:hypothetical protein
VPSCGGEQHRRDILYLLVTKNLHEPRRINVQVVAFYLCFPEPAAVFLLHSGDPRSSPSPTRTPIEAQ